MQRGSSRGDAVWELTIRDSISCDAVDERRFVTVVSTAAQNEVGERDVRDIHVIKLACESG